MVVLEDGARFPEGEEVTVVSLDQAKSSGSHSVLDIPTIDLGNWPPMTDSDDVLGEMLEDRRFGETPEDRR